MFICMTRGAKSRGGREEMHSLHAHGAAVTLTTSARLGRLFAIPTFWRLCVGAFFCIGVYFTNMSWLPGYLVKERGYSILSSGIYLTIPYLAAFGGMWLAGALGDRLGNRTAVALTMGLMSCPAIIALAYTKDVNTTIALMSLMLFLNSASLNGRCSPVAWISISRPSPASTKFESTSALESSA